MAEMTRILVAGVGPLPPERPGRLYAPGLRIWGMARELARAGHPVRLIRAQFGGQRDEAAQAGRLLRFDLEPSNDPALPEPVALEGGPRSGWTAWAGLLAREALEFNAGAAVGSTDVMNRALAAMDLPLPIWMDYFGDPMAERQLLALRHGSDDGLAEQWAILAPALARGDRFSGCSTDQVSAILAQLGVLGRLNRFTARERLAHCLAPWFEPIPMDIECEPVIRGTRTPQDAFIVIQTGGFNTWLDLETLFTALEQAMAANPRIHFAATGGAIPGHHEAGFEWFTRAIEASPCRERYHLLGWLPLGQVPRAIGEADLGVNVDFDCPEGRFGTRNRLLDWLAAGVPVISTPGCELAVDLAGESFIRLVRHGQPDALARAILDIAANPKPHRQAAGDGAKHLREELTARICLRDLIKWAAAPIPASDLQAWRDKLGEPSILLDQAEVLEKARRRANRLARLEHKMAVLEGSRLIRLALALRGRKGLEPVTDGDDEE